MKIDSYKLQRSSPLLEVEVATPDDAQDIMRIQAETWLATYPNAEQGVTYEGVRQRIEGANGEKLAAKIDVWRNRIKEAGQNQSVFIARWEGEPVGFVAPGLIGDQYRIGALYVLPEAQSRGVGSRLMRKALDWYGALKDVYLHVAEYNTRAISFYHKYGFEMTGRRFEDQDGKAIGASIPELEMVRPGRS